MSTAQTSRANAHREHAETAQADSDQATGSTATSRREGYSRRGERRRGATQPRLLTRLGRWRESAARALIILFGVTLVLTFGQYVFGGKFASLLLRIVYGTINIPATTSLVSLVILAVMVGGLVRRKRMALYLVGAFQVLGVAWSAVRLWRAVEHGWTGSITPGHPWRNTYVALERLPYLDVVAVLFGLAALAVVWWLRPAFPARVQPGAGVRAVVTALLGVAGSLWVAYALLGYAHVPAGADRSPVHALAAVVRNALGIPRGRDLQILAESGPYLSLVLELMLSATLVVSIWLFLRSTRPRDRWTGEREVEVRGLLARYGRDDSLGYFATRRDRSYAFSQDRQAVVAYRVVGSVALASGDPIGNRASWDSAVDTWLRTCREFGLIPAATAAGPEGARLLGERGFGVMPLGDEALLYPDRFTLDSTSMTSVRQAVARVRKAGVTVKFRRHSDLTDAEMDRFVTAADAWRRGEAERGFSMALERLADPADGRCLLVTAHDAEGEPVGLLSFVPWGRTGLSLDLMRRSPQAPNGTTELMVAELMRAADELGITQVSLNFAVARSVFADAEELGASPITRAGSGLLGLLDKFTQIESLYRNNERYRPEWSPRYVCFEGAAVLLPVGLAIGEAEGFLPRLVRHRWPGRRLTSAQVKAAVEAENALPAVVLPEPARSEQSRHRLRHLRELQEAGRDPYRAGRSGGVPLAEVGPLADRPGGETLTLTARVRRTRRHGGVVFADLTDNGATAQAILERDTLGAADLALFARSIDAGDLVVLSGTVGASRNGTASVLVTGWDVAAKALQPVPYGGLTDPGRRARARTLDLLVHPKAGETLRQRSRAIQAVRDTLLSHGYLEVETPILQVTNGGATARPFGTFSHAYGLDLVLRIAPELALKRLLAGDMGPVFEIGRNFRNEGADLTHNPEFTVVEAYEPFSDYTGMRLLTQEMVKAAARAVHGREVLPIPGEGGETEWMDISGDWPVVTVAEAVSAAVGEPVDHTTDLERLLAIARRHEVPVADGMGSGAVLEELYGELVESATVRPTFYCDFPLETSPLTGPHRSVPGLVERWDLVVRGAELGTAYSELNDPVEQRRRLTEQSLKAAAGDAEAMEVDEDFLAALEAGMPPAGGLGIGLDRLVMLLTGNNIREVLSFPFVRPERG